MTVKTLLNIFVEELKLLGRTLNHWFNRVTPKGLYTRALLIVIFPTLMLLSVTTYIFLERHWQLVTTHIARATTQDISALVLLYENMQDKSQENQQEKQQDTLKRAARKMELELDFLPAQPLPPVGARPFFDPLDKNLSLELAQKLNHSFWIDTVGRSNLIEIRVQTRDITLRFLARRGYSYASSSWIFLAWLLLTSLVVLGISLLFLRNQIYPILLLSQAAQNFGKGREPPAAFKPRGAREVRAAALSFIEMKKRIERAIDQRTLMLAGVSHDLRTILTRFQLELTFIPPSPEREAMAQDVREMNKMIAAYLDFAKGADGESVQLTNIADILHMIKRESARAGQIVHLNYDGNLMFNCRPLGFKRALMNLTSNAGRFASLTQITASQDTKFLTLFVDDNGQGIAENQREEVFKPFLRLDEARNQDTAGTGLGLAIARDIIRGAGGDIMLETSPLGGLRAIVRLPL
jgi:two-component system, OmpR family, osmolarity sensor histidine kinase EnvZ